MRFFTDQFFSEAQKTKLLENSHLIEHPSVKLGEQENSSHRSEPVFYMEWQQEPSVQAPEPDSRIDPPPIMDLSAVMVMMLVGGFGMMFVFDVLLN